MSDLAERLLLSRSGLTRLVDRLETAGFVGREPCEDDGRGWFALITPAGPEKLRAARATHLDGVRRHFLSRVERSGAAHPRRRLQPRARSRVARPGLSPEPV